MDEDRARDLLTAKRTELQELLVGTESDSQQDKEAQSDTGDIADPAQLLTAQGEDDAISESLRDRLAALERAEERLANGTYGKSVRSGLPIPDARLEADPTAELTIEEAREDPEVRQRAGALAGRCSSGPVL
jgi:DnaK suppressor protein